MFTKLTRKITNLILAIYIFLQPYTRNFKIFTSLRPAGSIITGRGFCMHLSVFGSRDLSKELMVQKTRLMFASNELSGFVNHNYHSGVGYSLKSTMGVCC